MQINPCEVAEQMAQSVALDFDYSLDSLQRDVDALLESQHLFIDTNMCCALECALGAYVGESLARLFDGVWAGDFCSDNPGANFYLSYVRFGEYRYFPSHFLSYYIENGLKEEGTFAQYLKGVLPMIQARTSSV